MAVHRQYPELHRVFARRQFRQGQHDGLGVVGCNVGLGVGHGGLGRVEHGKRGIVLFDFLIEPEPHLRRRLGELRAPRRLRLDQHGVREGRGALQAGRKCQDQDAARHEPLQAGREP